MPLTVFCISIFLLSCTQSKTTTTTIIIQFRNVGNKIVNKYYWVSGIVLNAHLYNIRINEMGNLHRPSACQGLIVVFQRKTLESCFELWAEVATIFFSGHTIFTWKKDSQTMVIQTWEFGRHFFKKKNEQSEPCYSGMETSCICCQPWVLSFQAKPEISGKLYPSPWSSRFFKITLIIKSEVI